MSDTAIAQQTIELIGLADVQVPYFEQYFGAWAMHDAQFRAMAEKLHGYDVKAHVLAVQSRPIEPKAAMGDGGDGRPYQLTRDGIAIIPIRGTLMKQVSSFSRGTSTVLLRRQLRAAADDSDVRAVLLHAESPGGTVAGTKELASDVAALAAKKRVEGYAEDLCASACYWVLAQCARIAANSMALVGSIGTYGVVYDYSANAAQQGIKVHVVRAGAFKGSGTPGTEVSAAELADYQKLIDEINSHFLQDVSAGRKRPLEYVKNLADGRVHMAIAAQGLGLIDAVETFDETLDKLRSSLSKSTGRQKMSTVNTPAADAVATTPAAASYDEIVAACPGADAAFVCEQLKAKATAAQATTNYMKHLSDANAKLASENKELATKQTQTTTTTAATPKKPGVEPVSAGKKPAADATDDSDPIVAWDEAVAAKVAKGLPRAKAIARVVAEQPELQKSYIAAYNELHAPKRA